MCVCVCLMRQMNDAWKMWNIRLVYFAAVLKINTMILCTLLIVAIKWRHRHTYTPILIEQKNHRTKLHKSQLLAAVTTNFAHAETQLSDNVTISLSLIFIFSSYTYNLSFFYFARFRFSVSLIVLICCCCCSSLVHFFNFSSTEKPIFRASHRHTYNSKMMFM